MKLLPQIRRCLWSGPRTRLGKSWGHLESFPLSCDCSWADVNKHLYTSDRRLTTDQRDPPSTPSLLNQWVCLGLLTEAWVPPGHRLLSPLSWHIRGYCGEWCLHIFLELFPCVDEFWLGKQPSLGCTSSHAQQRPSSSTTACFQAHSTGATFEVCNLFSHASAMGWDIPLL